MEKMKIEVDLKEIQEKIWGEIVKDFSIKDLNNAKKIWLENLVQYQEIYIGDERLLNDLYNFLNNIEFTEKQKEIEYDITIKIKKS